MTTIDIVLPKNINRLAGVDEVGRGPLAGPVVAACVILNPDVSIDGLRDSKALSAGRRTDLSDEIKEKSLCWSIARADVVEIDTINILHATMLAMKRAIQQMAIEPDYVLIDGNRCPDLNYPMQAIVKGDQRIPAISAASIIAKVYRDNEMSSLHEQYPEYGFDSHKGYPTRQHLDALKMHGVTPLHRKSFSPVRRALALQQSGNVCR